MVGKARHDLNFPKSAEGHRNLKPQHRINSAKAARYAGTKESLHSFKGSANRKFDVCWGKQYLPDTPRVTRILGLMTTWGGLPLAQFPQLTAAQVRGDKAVPKH